MWHTHSHSGKGMYKCSYEIPNIHGHLHWTWQNSSKLTIVSFFYLSSPQHAGYWINPGGLSFDQPPLHWQCPKTKPSGIETKCLHNVSSSAHDSEIAMLEETLVPHLIVATPTPPSKSTSGNRCSNFCIWLSHRQNTHSFWCSEPPPLSCYSIKNKILRWQAPLATSTLDMKCPWKSVCSRNILIILRYI